MTRYYCDIEGMVEWLDEHEERASKAKLSVAEAGTISALHAIAERLEAQVEATNRLTEAVKGLKAGPDCGPVRITLPESAAWKPDNDNLGPCGGE